LPQRPAARPEATDGPRGHRLEHDPPRPLPEQDTDRLGQLRERDDDLDRLTAYVRGFARMMTELRGDQLEIGQGAGPDTSGACTAVASPARK
jgi:hypothetical protein